MYEGKVSGQFSPVTRYHAADYATFQDGRHNCVGFRRTGNPRKGGYEKIVGGIFCTPAGRTLTNEQIVQFIDRVRVQ